MALQGPSAPITKFVLVRAPRALPPARKILSLLSREGGPTRFWEALTQIVQTEASPSQALVDAATTFLADNPAAALFVGPFTNLTPAAWDEIQAALRTEGLSAAVRVVKAKNLQALYSVDVQATDAFQASVWDQIAARLISKEKGGGFRPSSLLFDCFM